MFAVDHAAAALLLKRRYPSVPMTPLLISVQAMELMWVGLNPRCRAFCRRGVGTRPYQPDRIVPESQSLYRDRVAPPGRRGMKRSQRTGAATIGPPARGPRWLRTAVAYSRTTAVRFIVRSAPGLGRSFTQMTVLAGRCSSIV